MKEQMPEHRLHPILHDEPNRDMTSFVFRETLMSRLLISRNAYVQISRDGAGKILGFYPLLPNKVKVERVGNGELIYIYLRKKD